VYAFSVVYVVLNTVTLGAEAARGLASDQSIRAFLESQSQASFRGIVITLDFDHNVDLDTALLSALKLPMDWPAIQIPALSSRV
jgi:hypothetical protein